MGRGKTHGNMAWVSRWNGTGITTGVIQVELACYVHKHNRFIRKQ